VTDRAQLELGFAAPEAPRAGRLRHHHVRAHESVDEALAGEKRAARQEVAVLAWFQQQTACLPGFRATPSQVHSALGEGLRCPVQSIRRALTNLVTAEKLSHHPEDRRPGPWGAREGCWALAHPDATRHENATAETELAPSVKEPA
jgi:hypothetical protein